MNFHSSFVAKKMLNELLKTWTIVGSAAVQFTPNCLQSPISVKPVAANMKWANALVLASAISCIWNPSLENWDAICIQGDAESPVLALHALVVVVLVQDLPDAVVQEVELVGEEEEEEVGEIDATEIARVAIKISYFSIYFWTNPNKFYPWNSIKFQFLFKGTSHLADSLISLKN